MSFFEPSVSSIGLGHDIHRLPDLSPLLRRAYYSSYNYPSGQSKTNMYLLYGFVGINGGIFCYYQYLVQQARQGTPMPMFKFIKNFTVNLNSYRDDGRWWTLLTGALTHFDPMHILFNMVSFYYMGKMLAHTPRIGPAHLVTLILGSAIAGSAGHLYSRFEQLKARGQSVDMARGLGFSGAVMGIGSVAACLYPKAQMLVWGLVPVPLWGLMTGYFLYDGFYIGAENTNVGHAGHIGGLVFGLAYYAAVLRKGRLTRPPW